MNHLCSEENIGKDLEATLNSLKYERTIRYSRPKELQDSLNRMRTLISRIDENPNLKLQYENLFFQSCMEMIGICETQRSV